MIRDVADRDRIAGQPGEQRSGILLRQQMQASFLQIPQTRRKAVAEERHEAEMAEAFNDVLRKHGESPIGE